MRPRFAWVALLVLGIAVPALAQQPQPAPDLRDARFELVFGLGTRTIPGAVATRLSAPQSNGYASFDWNLDRRLALVFAAPSIAVPTNMPVEYSWLAGTRIRFGDRRLMPFAQALGGAARGRVGPITFGANQPTRTDFQYALSGGVDLRFTRRVFWRLVQMEQQVVTGAAGYSTSAVWTGVVLRFGARDRD
jgi:hypothetical protein